jgi:hypothetical protein
MTEKSTEPKIGEKMPDGPTNVGSHSGWDVAPSPTQDWTQYPADSGEWQHHPANSGRGQHPTETEKRISNPMIEQAVREGVRQGKDEAAQAAKAAETNLRARSDRLAEAFNVAGGVIQGLRILQELPGSRFEFQAKDQIDRMFISTNVPVSSGGRDSTLYIIADAAGNISAYGDSPYDATRPPDMMGAKNTEPKAAEKVTTFVAKLAARRGLIP